MLLSVIYVNYNTTEVLLDSLRSLRDHLELEYEVIVVDNASQKVPLDADGVTAIAPGARIVQLQKNVGFGQGNNRGVALAKGEYLWILNTDTIVPPDHRIDEVVRWLSKNHQYAAAIPLVLNPDGSWQQGQVGRFPTATRIIADRLGLPSALHYRADRAQRDVDWASGAALVVRSSSFAEVGGFSPDFFFFLEDVDLSKKLSRRGYKVRHLTDSKIIHLKGASTAGLARRRMYYDAVDIYFRRWGSPVGRRTVNTLTAYLRSHADK